MMSSRKSTSYDVAEAAVKTSQKAELVWFGQAVQLQDFPEQYPTPNLVKIVQGEYMNLGPKNGSNDEGKENELLIYSVQTSTKVLGVNLRIKEGRGVIQTENKLSIPLTYEGWFEVLSEDGRRVKPIESIKDLARIFPHTCLVRKAIEALVPLPDGTIRNDSKRTVAVGETMTLFGIMQLSINGQDGLVNFLRCLDMQGNSLYFREEQEGHFSPVAGKENISGVHTIKGILNKFHLPVTCKLVHGTYPKTADKNKFSGIMRIVYVYDESHAFVCPASGQYRMISIPAEVPMKVVPAVNFDEIKGTEIISKVLDQCRRMVKCYGNSVHLLYDVDVLPPPKSQNTVTQKPAEAEEEKKDANADDLYDEVEDIYFYVVRHGVAPPAIPKRLYKEGEQDNDYWEQPIYKTLHKPRQRQSIVDMTKENKETKMYRFYHEGDKASRPLAYIKTGNEVDKPLELSKTPQAPKLVARRLSETQNPMLEKKEERKRRKSQPAIIRFFFKSKDDKDTKAKGSGASSDGSNGKGSSGNDRKNPTRAKDKMKNMYL